MALRELAARVGVSHYTLHHFIHGKPVLPSTSERIRRWLDEPGAEDTVERLRTDLRALLGRLGSRRAKLVEAALGRVIVEAFERAGVEVPNWVKRLGRKQV